MKKFILFLICFLLIAQAGMMTASANAGPPTYATLGDKTALVPAKNASVNVLSESLVYTILKDKTAEVSATYEMMSTAPDAQRILVAFVSGNVENEPAISFDGTPVEITKEPAGGAPIEFGSVDTMTQDIVKETNLIYTTPGEQQVQYTYFYLTFLPDKTHQLDVKYTETPTLQKNRIRTYGGYMLPTSIYYYFLLPAAYWNSFKDLTVEIRGLHRFDKFQTNFDNFTWANGVYTAHFDTLPDKNLIIQTKPGVDLVLDALLYARDYLILAAVAAAIIFVTARRVKKRKQK